MSYLTFNPIKTPSHDVQIQRNPSPAGSFPSIEPRPQKFKPKVQLEGRSQLGRLVDTSKARVRPPQMGVANGGAKPGTVVGTSELSVGSPQNNKQLEPSAGTSGTPINSSRGGEARQGSNPEPPLWESDSSIKSTTGRKRYKNVTRVVARVIVIFQIFHSKLD